MVLLAQSKAHTSTCLFPCLSVHLSLRQVPEFQLFPRPSTAGAYHPAERQLGLLSCFHRDGWLLSWNEYSVYVVDCLNEVPSLSSSFVVD